MKKEYYITNGIEKEQVTEQEIIHIEELAQPFERKLDDNGYFIVPLTLFLRYLKQDETIN